MKKPFLAITFLLGTLAISCNQTCDCSEPWDETVTYVKNESVSHNGQCWEAVAQGRGLEPGPWLQNGNDIWEECDD